MTYRFKVLILILSSLHLYCIFRPDKKSHIPEDQAEIIRLILKENGYNISQNEFVDDYLEFSSSSEHVDSKDKYWILLPSKNQHYITLSDNINELDNPMFIGIKSFSSTSNVSLQEENLVDNIYIKSDSTIHLPQLILRKNKINLVPENINLLRVGTIDLKWNQLTVLPSAIMGMSTGPLPYDTLFFKINYNKIDTTKCSLEIIDWLNTYAEENWQSTQNPD